MPLANCGWMCRRAGRPSRARRRSTSPSSGEQQELAFDVTPPAGEATAIAARRRHRGRARDRRAACRRSTIRIFPSQTLFPPADLKLVRADIKVTRAQCGLHHGRGRRDAGCAAPARPGGDAAYASPTWRRATFRASTPLWPACGPTTCGPICAPTRRASWITSATAALTWCSTRPATCLNMGPYPFTCRPARAIASRWRKRRSPSRTPRVRCCTRRTASRRRDFEGWVQERGLYFATRVGPALRDGPFFRRSRREALEGGELWTHYGKGVYIFTGLCLVPRSCRPACRAPTVCSPTC